MQEPRPATLAELVAALEAAAERDRAAGREPLDPAGLALPPGLAGLPLALLLRQSLGGDCEHRRFGSYRLLGEIGRDESSVRHHAIDQHDRLVVLRIFDRRPELGRRDLEALRADLELARSLGDEALVDVLDADLVAGVVQIAERPASARSLAALLADMEGRDDDPAARLELLRATAAAARLLDRGHELGLVHARLDPSCILVAGDAPLLKGLGIAALEGDRPLRQSPAQLAYRAPEQLGETPLRTDRRADVWSLGAIVHRIVTGEPPIPAPTEAELRREAARFVPRAARARERGLPSGLDAVIAAALAPERSRRYARAAAFADDLDRALAGVPPLARRPGLGNRFVRWMRREPGIAAAGFVIFALLGTAGIVTGWFVGVGDRDAALVPLERQIARDAELRAREARERRELEKDRRLIEVLDELGVLLEVFTSGRFGPVPHAALIDRHVAAFAERGIELDRRLDADAAAAQIGGAQGRSPRNGRRLLAGLYRLLPPIAAARAGETRALDEDTLGRLDLVERNLIVLLERCETDPAFRHLWRIARHGDATAPDRFDVFLDPGHWQRQSAEYLLFLADCLGAVTERREAARKLVGDAVGHHADSLALHVREAAQIFRTSEPDRSLDPGPAARALLQLEVATALAPRSAATRTLLALAQLTNGDPRGALQNVGEATRIAPDAPLVWLLRARFFLESPLGEQAREAAERALELDAGLEEARAVLDEIETRRR